MLVYRVFPYLPTAKPGESGGPMYLHRPQGRGRLDNPADYDTWYFGITPETAIGEAFGDLAVWREEMFEFPSLPGARRALGVFEIPDDTAVLDLDDARNLLDRGLRPTQVVARNRPTTQAWALRIFNETGPDGSRRWAGVRWWSFQRPHWTVIALWVTAGAAPIHSCLRVETLTIDHPAVVDAARSLGKRRLP